MRLLLTGGFLLLAGRIADTLVTRAGSHPPFFVARGSCGCTPLGVHVEVRHCDVLGQWVTPARSRAHTVITLHHSMSAKRSRPLPRAGRICRGDAPAADCRTHRRRSTLRVLLHFPCLWSDRPRPLMRDAPSFSPLRDRSSGCEGFLPTGSRRGQDVLIVRPPMATARLTGSRLIAGRWRTTIFVARPYDRANRAALVGHAA